MTQVRLLGWWFAASMALGVISAGCNRDSEQAAPAASSAAADGTSVLLTGTFQRVAKAASGRAEIIRRGNEYSLRLSHASVDSSSEVHVYLVGLPDVASTAELIATDTVYDFGPLEQGANEQLIELPSEPAPELKTVVLFEPRYHVNLARAPLH